MYFMLQRKGTMLTMLTAACLFFQSCTRNTIEFGDDPENNYTHIVFIDTIGVSLSTVLTDSFETSGAASFLLGKYKDPYLGIISAKPFFQMTVPSSIAEIPSSAQYDSINLIVRLNDYYYGDTAKQQTIYVNELAQSIAYSYNNKLYNTSNVPVKPAALGARTLFIRPHGDDSIMIRLNDATGLELFSKLRQQSTEVTNADEFLNYFKGISITTGDNDTTAIYGLEGNSGSIVMRVYYHATIPYPESKYIDFTSQVNNYAFNQVLANRSGTGIVPGGFGLTEISASQTNNHSFMQTGTGVYLKMIFPSLKAILGSDKIVKLLKAELIIRPEYLSFDNNKYKLPSQVYLTLTGESNNIGSQVVDSTGSSVQYASPVTDDLYGENNYYRFNVTSYINQWLNTAGSEDEGFYVLHNASDNGLDVTRLIVNNSFHGSKSSQLLLHLLVVNK